MTSAGQIVKLLFNKNQLIKWTFYPFTLQQAHFQQLRHTLFTKIDFPNHKLCYVSDWIIHYLTLLVPSSVPWKSQHLHCHWQQMESGRPVTSRARGWREGRLEEAGTSCLISRTPASLLQCVMSQQWQRELISGLPCTKAVLTRTCTLLASTFIRSAKHEGRIVSFRVMGHLPLCTLCLREYFSYYISTRSLL